MAKGRNNKSAGTRSWIPRCPAPVVHTIAAITFLVAGGYGFLRLREHVQRDVAVPQHSPAVHFKARPPWMTDALEARILAGVRVEGTPSAMDPSVLQSVQQRIVQDPWIKQVRLVRRSFGREPGDTIEIDCEFRSPMAMVRAAERGASQAYFLIDGDGYRLPETYPTTNLPRAMFDPDGRIILRIIEGVAAAPPRAGQQWTGADLSAGLDVAKLLYGHAFTGQITCVDVSNFAHRRHRNGPQLALLTRFNSRIEWGEPVTMVFHAELTPIEKLNRLAAFYNGPTRRVDGGYSWLDIRLERPGVRTEEAPVAGAGVRISAENGG